MHRQFGATLMRAQLVALSLFASVQSKELRRLSSSHVHPSCGKRQHIILFCSLDVTPTCGFNFASLDTNQRPTRILLSNVDPCDTLKLRRACYGVNFTCSRSGCTHRKTSEPLPSEFAAEFCHSLVKALMAEPHARCSCNQSNHSSRPCEHHTGDDLAYWSIVVLSARFWPRSPLDCVSASKRMCICSGVL